MIKSKLCSSSPSSALFSCCVAYEDPSEHKIDRRAIGPPMDFRHLAHMGSSGGSTSVTSSVISGVGLDDAPTQAPVTTHLKLIELSEALAAHNATAAAAMRAVQREQEASSQVETRRESVNREHRKSSVSSRYLISGPLPPPPPPPPSSALIT